MTFMKSYFLSSFITFILITNCKKELALPVINETYLIDNAAYWKQKDESRVYYLEVIALHKLDSSDNTFGKGIDNKLKLNIENLPETIGTISVEKDGVKFLNFKSIDVRTKTDSIVTSMTLELDKYGSSQMLYHDRLSWRVITRSGQHYMRVWDKQNPQVKIFKGFEKFELNSELIFDAYFSYYEDKKTEIVKSEVDGQRNTSFIGQVTFKYNEESYALDVGESGFTMVADDTSDDLTYGGGRYIYLDLPKTNGQVKLDFNRLYNPPCAFNKYTTCLYPPRQNYLPFEVLAGETKNQIK